MGLPSTGTVNMKLRKGPLTALLDIPRTRGTAWRCTSPGWWRTCCGWSAQRTRTCRRPPRTASRTSGSWRWPARSSATSTSSRDSCRPGHFSRVLIRDHLLAFCYLSVAVIRRVPWLLRSCEYKSYVCLSCFFTSPTPPWPWQML